MPLETRGQHNWFFPCANRYWTDTYLGTKHFRQLPSLFHEIVFASHYVVGCRSPPSQRNMWDESTKTCFAKQYLLLPLRQYQHKLPKYIRYWITHLSMQVPCVQCSRSNAVFSIPWNRFPGEKWNFYTKDEVRQTHRRLCFVSMQAHEASFNGDGTSKFE